MKRFLAFLLLPLLLISGENSLAPPVNDVWFEYHIEPTQYWPIPNSSPHFTTAWYEEIILPYCYYPQGNIRGIEFYIVHNTISQIRFENVGNGLTGSPTTWDRVNHQVKFYIDEGPFIDSLLGINSFTEGGGSHTVWSPFDGTIDGQGPSGFTSPKSFKKNYTRNNFNLAAALAWINGPRKPGFTVRVEGRTRFLFDCPEDLWVMQLLEQTSVDLRVRYILE